MSLEDFSPDLVDGLVDLPLASLLTCLLDEVCTLDFDEWSPELLAVLLEDFDEVWSPEFLVTLLEMCSFKTVEWEDFDEV